MVIFSKTQQTHNMRLCYICSISHSGHIFVWIMYPVWPSNPLGACWKIFKVYFWESSIKNLFLKISVGSNPGWDIWVLLPTYFWLWPLCCRWSWNPWSIFFEGIPGLQTQWEISILWRPTLKSSHKIIKKVFKVVHLE